MKILVAEDDLISQKLIATILSPYGTVETASDGQSAIDMLNRASESGQPYALVCLDVMMPFVDGIKVLAHLRSLESSRGVPEESQAAVIMITAIDSQDSFLRSFREGSQWYVTKPIKRAEFEVALAELGFERSS